MKEIWNEKTARWYSQALGYSSYPRNTMRRLLPRLGGIKSVLDVGAGVGALSIPLAKVVKRVTALEPSQAMINILKRRIKRGKINNITVIEAGWGQVPLPCHDAVLAASVPIVLKDAASFISQAEKVARVAVFVILGVHQERNKFMFDELYPLLFGKEYPEKGDCLDFYSTLHKMGIYADVDIYDYRFDQRFKDLDEAVDFWKEHMGLKTNEHDTILKDFLSRRLKIITGGYLLEIKKKSALISWRW